MLRNPPPPINPKPCSILDPQNLDTGTSNPETAQTVECAGATAVCVPAGDDLRRHLAACSALGVDALCEVRMQTTEPWSQIRERATTRASSRYTLIVESPEDPSLIRCATTRASSSPSGQNARHSSCTRIAWGTPIGSCARRGARGRGTRLSLRLCLRCRRSAWRLRRCADLDTRARDGPKLCIKAWPKSG
jgi:hypothetical protein